MRGSYEKKLFWEEDTIRWKWFIKIVYKIEIVLDLYEYFEHEKKEYEKEKEKKSMRRKNKGL